MARSIDDKLQRLLERRTDMANKIFKDGLVQTESFEKRASTDATRYTLGLSTNRWPLTWALDFLRSASGYKYSIAQYSRRVRVLILPF